MFERSKYWTLLVAASIGLCANAARAQKAALLTPDSVSPGIYGFLATPPKPGIYPGLIILHGSAGWRPAYAEYARMLADSGFAALAIDYYAETGPDTGSVQASHLWPIWQATVRRAAQWLAGQPSAAGSNIGLVGISRGAFLAVSVAASMPNVNAVVDFYGGVNTRGRTVEEQVHNFPPLLILHGEADTVVPVAYAHKLCEAVTRSGGEVEMHLYPGVHHAFNGTFSPTYSEQAAVDSFRRTVEFLKRRLSQKRP